MNSGSSASSHSGSHAADRLRHRLVVPDVAAGLHRHRHVRCACTTTTFSMLGQCATAVSALVFIGMSFFLPRSAVSCVIRILQVES